MYVGKVNFDGTLNVVALQVRQAVTVGDLAESRSARNSGLSRGTTAECGVWPHVLALPSMEDSAEVRTTSLPRVQDDEILPFKNEARIACKWA